MRPIFDIEATYLTERLGIDIPKGKLWIEDMRFYGFTKYGDRILIGAMTAKGSLRLIKWNRTLLPYLADWQELLNLNCYNAVVCDSAGTREVRLFAEDDSYVKLQLLHMGCRVLKIEDASLDGLTQSALCDITEMAAKFKAYCRYVSDSSGKDSEVVTDLVYRALGKDVTRLFINSSNECHHSLLHVKHHNPLPLEIINPDVGYYPYIKSTNFIPTTTKRLCCTRFKEGLLLQKLPLKERFLFFLGMRKCESETRKNYTLDWKNEKWGNTEWQGVLPIVDWSDMDVWLYIIKHRLSVNPLYKMGFARVGCVICSFRTDYELLLTEHFLPSYHKRWQAILEEDFKKNVRWLKLNCTLEEYLKGAWRKAALVRRKPNDAVIEEFANYKGIDKKLARKYFGTFCSCGAALSAQDVGLSLRLFGDSALLCSDCLSIMLGTTKSQLDDQVHFYRSMGCGLF